MDTGVAYKHSPVRCMHVSMVAPVLGVQVEGALGHLQAAAAVNTRPHLMPADVQGRAGRPMP